MTRRISAASPKFQGRAAAVVMARVREMPGRRHIAMRMTLAAAALIAAYSLAIAPVSAADASTPDWPCVQRKVAEMTPAQMWDGPSIDGNTGYYKDERIRKLLPALVQRRIPMEDVEAAIEKFAEETPEAERDALLTTLFAGVFDRSQSLRTTVMKGIEKFQIRQRDRAAKLEREGVELGKLRKKANQSAEDIAAAEKAQETYDWDARIFQERQANIPVACEIPELISQRAYAIAQAIRAQMS